MTWTSTVPAAIDALVATFRTAAALEGVTVLDGPLVSTGAKEVITVGYTGDPTSSSAVENITDLEGLSLSAAHEQYTIHCAANVLKGNANISAARARAYELLAAAGAALVADPRLGGVVTQARIGAHSLSQTQNGKGATAVVMFDVDVEAFTRP